MHNTFLCSAIALGFLIVTTAFKPLDDLLTSVSDSLSPLCFATVMIAKACVRTGLRLTHMCMDGHMPDAQLTLRQILPEICPLMS